MGIENKDASSNQQSSYLLILREIKDLKRNLRDKKIEEIQVLQGIHKIQEAIKNSNLKDYELENLHQLLKYLFYVLEEIYPKIGLDSQRDSEITKLYEKIMAEGTEPPTPEQIAMFKYLQLKDLSYEIGDTELHGDFLDEETIEKENIKQKKNDILNSLSIEERKILSKEFERDIESLLKKINEAVLNFFTSQEGGKDSERENWQRIGKRIHQIISWEFLPAGVTSEIRGVLKEFEEEFESQNLNLGILIKLTNIIQISRNSNIFNS